MYIEREVEEELEKWRISDNRKPLLIRGARQVGKSSTIRNFGKKFTHFVEINFDANMEYGKVFEKQISPKEVCEELAILSGKKIIEQKTLLFLDEIQLCPRAISSLRYFYEQMPDLHVIATGSLLEFVLSDLPSFGVGRIHSIFMYPFSFFEFLHAIDQGQYVEVIKKASPTKPIFELGHQKLTELLKKFIIIGGMPEAVATYAKTQDLLKIQRVLEDIVNAYQTDFSKYKNRVPSVRISTVLNEVAKRTGTKFMYVDLTDKFKNEQIKEALELLRLAGLIYPTTHTSANGIPLGAEIDPKKVKYLLFDTGIYLNILGLNLGGILLSNDVDFVNKGNLAELFAGIELIKSNYQHKFPELYYWHRQAKSSQAEIDYVIQKNEAIVPLEIKASKSGAMKSMHLFLKEKNSSLGLRISLENFSEYGNIRVVPLYAVGVI
ncbi:MAG: ATP-binding protein [Leadbetterella sp.]